ncbi:hypothetical protein SDC49_08705 [Lactobacillus sp. R2/2]|nr:hypothetical protein [Lactobacillus sp. R2/2]MEB3363788.1 hypothetical protein [Lactobacillus sp. R2/2]
MSQGELDHIFITQDMNNLNDETGLPKGLSDFSLTKIKTAISQLAGEFSNQDVARQSKLSRITTKNIWIIWKEPANFPLKCTI